MPEAVDEIVGFEEPGDELDRLAYEVIGAALAVHKDLGAGHLESVYEEALCVELEYRGIPFERQKTYEVFYRGRKVGGGRFDLLVGGTLIVETKAVEDLAPVHTAQIIGYPKANRCRLGLLFNFNVSLLKNGVRRVAYTKQ
jgi:GxxExxY protein